MSNVTQQLEQSVREIYCKLRNQWVWDHQHQRSDWGSKPIPRYDGGRDSSGRNHSRPIWASIAERILELQANPFDYLKAQFVMRQNRLPEPNQLVSDAAVALYREYANELPERERLSFEFQRKTASFAVDKLKPCRTQLGWTDEKIMKVVIDDPNLNLSPLFRYCLAVECRYEDLMTKYEEAARLQLCSQVALYRSIWGAFLPDHLLRTDDRETAHRHGGTPVVNPRRIIFID